MARTAPVNEKTAIFPRTLKWLTRSVAALVVLGALLATVPFFLSIDDYVPLLEKELTARLQRPVSIDGLDAALFPLPHATIDGIAIGDAEEIKVRKVTVKPDLWSLAGTPKVIRSIDFEDVVLTHEGLGALLAATQGERQSGAVRVDHVKLRGATVKLDRGSFGPFDADVQVSGDARQGELTLRTQDGALSSRIVPQGDKFELEITAKEWTPPFGLPVRFDALEVSGSATRTEAELAMVNAKLYGGTAQGKLSIAWADGLSLSGQLEVKQVALKEAAALVSPKTRVSGRLDARPTFKAAAARAGELHDALRLDAPFTITDGVLYGLDIAGAAGALMNQGGAGGETRFEEFAGRLAIDQRAYRFTQLRIASGSLLGRGHVSIAPSRALSGQLNTSVKGVTVGAGIPLVIAGTLDSPSVYPDAKALAASAASSARLPSSLGPALGGRLGELADVLTGQKRKR